MFNFFQKKNKQNRPDSDRTPKAEPPDIQNKKSGTLPVPKKEDADIPKKSINAPANMNPHISEKSSNLIPKNSYVFKIKKDLNKIIAKKAIENHYGVKIVSVNILNTKSKKRIRGNIVGKKVGYKKAIVQLQEGYKIEF